MIEKDKMTPYDWCLEANMRILDEFTDEVEENWFFTTPIGKKDFMWYIGEKTVKPNSTPRKTAPFLEYRMYGLVPYNISSIQAGIQYGHALQEYNNFMIDECDFEALIKPWNKWRRIDKTFIICNGGTTNEDPNDKWYGSMQQMRDKLNENGVVNAEFKEPDLNNALSGIVFLVDERVFNEELYPNYEDMPKPWKDKGRGYKPKDQEMDKWEVGNIKNRKKWVEKIGGPKNDFLRTFTHKHVMRLANN